MDTKGVIIVGVFVLVIGVLIYFIVIPSGDSESKGLTEIQKTACEAANEGGTCFTKLSELALVLPEDCCKELNLCCPNP